MSEQPVEVMDFGDVVARRCPHCGMTEWIPRSLMPTIGAGAFSCDNCDVEEEDGESA